MVFVRFFVREGSVVAVGVGDALDGQEPEGLRWRPWCPLDPMASLGLGQLGPELVAPRRPLWRLWRHRIWGGVMMFVVVLPFGWLGLG
jgi:hypothetical protein